MGLGRAIGRRLRDYELPGLKRLENWMLNAACPEGEAGAERVSLPLVLIVGPPRVGSTLMSQLLASQNDFFHFDNLQHTLLRYPYLAFRLSRRLLRDRRSSFRSEHGFVEGFAGISEGNYFWPHWFDMSLLEKAPEPRPERVQHVRRVLNQIYAETHRPMLNAANGLSFYLKNLAQEFERMLVVAMWRDPVATALSIFRGRLRYRSSIQEWWSIRPKACTAVHDLDPHRQVVCQIVEIYRSLQSQRKGLEEVPFVDVSYEEMCTSPLLVMARISEACSRASMDLVPRVPGPSLPILQVRGPRAEEKEEAKRFEDLFKRVDWSAVWGDTGDPPWRSTRRPKDALVTG